MTTAKKLISLALVLAMCAGLAATSLAAEGKGEPMVVNAEELLKLAGQTPTGGEDDFYNAFPLCSSVGETLSCDLFFVSDGALMGYGGPGGHVEIPAGKGIKSIGGEYSYMGGAFEGAKNVTSVTIPDGVTDIYLFSFFETGMQYVVIPKSVTHIREGAFWGLKPDDVEDAEYSLTDIYYAGTEAQWKAIQIDYDDVMWEGQGNDALKAATIHYNSTGPDATPAPVMTADENQMKVEINGEALTFQSYVVLDANGNGSNYVKIRDLAKALAGTSAEFEVGWKNRTVTVTSGQKYTPNGQEWVALEPGSKTYEKEPVKLLINGVERADLDYIQIKDANGNGANYFKIRDLAAAIGFNIDNRGRTVLINTEK